MAFLGTTGARASCPLLLRAGCPRYWSRTAPMYNHTLQEDCSDRGLAVARQLFFGRFNVARHQSTSATTSHLRACVPDLLSVGEFGTRTNNLGKFRLAESVMGVAAFTMVELLVTIGIVAILASLLVVGWPTVLSSAANARCLGNMKSLHVSLSSRVQDLGHWPQVPEDLEVSDAEDWWLSELKDYGGAPEVWQCPVIQRQITSAGSDGRPKIHYSPTRFDEKPGTPYRWSTQPWLIEIGNMHGRGANICFPDGSIRPMIEVTGPLQ